MTRSNESIANSCYEWSILSDRVFKNDMLLMIYETADIMSSGKLTTLGAVNEQVNDHRDAPMRSVAVQQYDAPMFQLARQFSQAETIVIAAPFWDLSFPAALKQYFEQISVAGITFKYTEEGVPIGLCKADKLFFVTTAGGNYVPEEYCFGYIKALAQVFYQINVVRMIKAVGLDIDGADCEGILRAAEEAIGKDTFN